MSLSWLDTRFGVATVRLSRTAVSIGPQRRARVEATPAAGHGEPPWQASLKALEHLLQADASKRTAKRLRLVLANEFVRYLLVPWKAERLTEAEREQLARALLFERFGEGNGKWHLVLEAQRYAKPSLAAAIDADMMAELKSLTSRAGCRLVSMVPALVDELNRHRRQIGKVASGWLVDASEGRLATLAFAGDTWAQVGNERYASLSAALKEMLLPLLRRDTLRMPDLAGGTVFLVNGVSNDMPRLIDQAWPLVKLAGAR